MRTGCYPTPGPLSPREAAYVSWFSPAKGFGFLSLGPNTPEIFVHMETLRKCGVRELRPGQKVFARYFQGEKGRIASEIEIADPTHDSKV